MGRKRDEALNDGADEHVAVTVSEAKQSGLETIGVAGIMKN